MRRVWFSVIVAVALLQGEASTSEAKWVKMGQKIFKKKLRKVCRFSGVRFARHHTMDEWEKLWEEGEFDDEAKRICPKLDTSTIKPEWWKALYHFSYEYAKDGKRVPNC